MSFELFCKYWNPHQVEEVNCMLSTACRPQTSRNQKVDDAESPLSHHWSIRRTSMSWSCSAPWKLWASSLPPPGRGTQSCGHQPTVAPFAWQSNKAISFGAVLCLVAQSCLTLCNPMDYSPPGSSVHSMLQTRVLEWVAMPSSRGSSHLPHCRRILYHLTHQGKSKNTGVGTYPFSGSTSWPRNQTRVSCIAGRSWPTELPVEFLFLPKLCLRDLIRSQCTEAKFWQQYQIPTDELNDLSKEGGYAGERQRNGHFYHSQKVCMEIRTLFEKVIWKQYSFLEFKKMFIFSDPVITPWRE